MNRLEIENPGRTLLVMNQIRRDVQRRVGANPLGICPVDLTLNYLRMCHAQTCGKCVPCRIGLGQLADMIEQVLDGDADEQTLVRIERTARVIRDTADCAIGYEAARMVISAIEGFRDDFLEHIQYGRCVSGLKLAIPCEEVCPAHVNVPGYIALVKEGRYEDALRLIRKNNPFPAVCGYVCEHPCEMRCRRTMVDAAVNICGIKRYAYDHAGPVPMEPRAALTGKRVAIVGGGPGGLTTAYFLTRMGHDVTVYEQRVKLGGMLRYGIPDYRLPQKVLDDDIQYILDAGVSVILNTTVDDIDALKAQYDAVYISIGAHDDKKLGLDGESADGVVSAVRMLRNVGEGKAPDLAGKDVVVVGGGNVAMDATRTSLRLGAAKVTCVYRRRIEDMTALPEEVEEAQAEGVHFLTLHAPSDIEVDENEHVQALLAQPQMISTIGADGRTSVRAAEKPAVRIPCDYVIVAIGQSIHSKPFEEQGIETRRGAIKAEKTCYVPGSGNVFAGGDAVSGPATVIRAVAAGRVAADNIDQFLGYQHTIDVDVEVPPPRLSNSPACGRVQLTSREIDQIEGDFDLVAQGMSRQECEQECSRCLRCDHFGYGIFKGGLDND